MEYSMKTTTINKYTTYTFKCPYCSRFWSFDSDVDTDDENYDDIKLDGRTVCKCKYGRTFEAKINK